MHGDAGGPSPFPVLVGPSCELRVLTMDDVDEWRAGDDPEQQRWFNAPGPAPRANVEAAIRRWRNEWRNSGPVRHWGIWHGPLLAGGVELNDRGRGRVYVSYLVFPRFRRQGLAGAAVELALDWGFRQLPVTVAVAVIDELNAASIAVVERLGFVLDGRADPEEASEPGVMNRYLRTNPAPARPSSGPRTAS